MIQFKKIVKKYILIGICGLLALSSVILTIEAATSGMEISELEKVESKLIARNSELEENLVRVVSLNELEKKGDSLGFVKASDLVYIKLEEPVADASKN